MKVTNACKGIILGVSGLGLALFGALPTQAQSPRTVTLAIASADDTISENRGTTTITASLDRASTEATSITISAVPTSPAIAADFALSTNKTLAIAAGQTASTGVVTITAADNTLDAAAKTITITAAVTGGQGAQAAGSVSLTISDDDPTPTVALTLADEAIAENGGSTTMTATLSGGSGTATTVTVTPLAGVYAAGADAIISIPAGATSNSADTATVVAVDNNFDAPDRSVTVNASASNGHGVGTVTGATLSITDDEALPTATLALTSSSISENGGSTTVTASLNHESVEAITLMVAAAPGAGASAADFNQTGRMLSIAGGTTSTGTVTIAAVNNAAHAANKTVTVRATASGGRGINAPAPVALTLTEDDAVPQATLAVSPSSITEGGASATVTATLDRASEAPTTLTVAVSAASPATDNDFLLSANKRLEIAAGATASTGTVSVTGVNNSVYAGSKSIAVSATAQNRYGVTAPATTTLTIADDEAAPPGKPANVQLAARTGALAVSWDAATNADGYTVQWKSGASAFAASRQATVATTDYTITGLTPGTEYTVRVIATRTNAADGAASDAATGTPKAAPPGQPGTATVTPGIGTLAVSWSAATNASGYKVQWRSGAQNYAATRQATATTTGHVVTGLAAGTQYTVRIIATRTNADDGMASVAASGTPLAAPPGQPAGVILMRGVGSLAVSWTAAANADGYKVQWKSGSESWSAGRQQTASGTSATIAGLAPGTTYSVRVIATRANAADGVASVLESAQPKAAPPNQVATVTVTSGVNQLVVSWAAATNAAGYKVQWKSGSQAYGSARQTTLAATSHTITGLANGTTYSVRVIATRANADDSAPSPEVSGTPTPARPAAPAVVQAEIATGGITVQWSVVENADGYRVQWKSSTQNYSTTRQATVDAPTNKEDTTTSYTITGLIEKETYTVRVFATRTGAQDSPASSEATADAGVGGTPTSLLTITPGVGTLVLSWPDVKDATDYKVQWKSGSQNYDATRQTIVATTLGNTETHTITSLTGGTEYTVRVTPRINTVDQTSFEGTGTPRTTAPGRPTVTVAAGVGQLLVRWTGATNASGYQVQWKSGTQAYDVSRQATVTSSSYTITGLTPNTVYTVRVIATRALAAADTPSADRTGTPRAAPPGQVETVAVTPGIGSLALSWTPAADATGYKVQWIYGAQTFVDDALQILRPSTPTCQSTPPRCTVNYTIPSLTAGTAYRVRVIATRTNAADGAPSVPASGVPRAAAPGQPTGVTVTAEVGALAVSWTAAANADGYKVQWKTGGDAWSASRQQTASGTSATITGLAAGIEYTVRVIATRANAADGPASTTSTGAAQTTSALAPESITVTQGVEQLVVRWSAPTNTSGYKVQWKSGGQSYNTGDRQATATSTMHTITGLTGGTRYTMRVIATRLNAPDSAPSAEASGTPRAARRERQLRASPPTCRLARRLAASPSHGPPRPMQTATRCNGSPAAKATTPLPAKPPPPAPAAGSLA